MVFPQAATKPLLFPQDYHNEIREAAQPGDHPCSGIQSSPDGRQWANPCPGHVTCHAKEQQTWEPIFHLPEATARDDPAGIATKRRLILATRLLNAETASE